MEIVIEPHTLKRAEERGTNTDEITTVLEQGVEIPARGNRKAKAKVFTFKRERLGKYYEEKRVEVVYVEEEETIITVLSMYFTENGKIDMQIIYSPKSDFLYIRLDEQTQDVINQRVSEDVVLDMGSESRIIGIEIMDASLRLNLKTIFPVEFQVAVESHT